MHVPCIRVLEQTVESKTPRPELIICWRMMIDNLFSTVAYNWDWIFWQEIWELESTIINTVAASRMHIKILRGKKFLILPLFQEWRTGKAMRSCDSQRSGLIFDEAANLWHLKCPKVSSRLKGAHVHMCSLLQKNWQLLCNFGSKISTIPPCPTQESWIMVLRFSL